MKTAVLGQAKIETTAETPLACSTPEQQLRSWRVGAAFTATREVMARWRRRVLTRIKPATSSDGDLRDIRDIRRIRADVEAVRSKAFWWA